MNKTQQEASRLIETGMRESLRAPTKKLIEILPDCFYWAEEDKIPLKDAFIREIKNGALYNLTSTKRTEQEEIVNNSKDLRKSYDHCSVLKDHGKTPLYEKIVYYFLNTSRIGVFDSKSYNYSEISVIPLSKKGWTILGFIGSPSKKEDDNNQFFMLAS